MNEFVHLNDLLTYSFLILKIKTELATFGEHSCTSYLLHLLRLSQTAEWDL